MVKRLESEPLVCVRRLKKSYDGDNLVLKGVDVSFEQSDLVSIIGPSGCGKSTFLRCLNCLEILDEGEIRIAGIDLKRESWHAREDAAFHLAAHRLRQHVGMVFQSFNLFSNKTVLDNIMLAPMVVKGDSKEKAEATAVALMDKVGLGRQFCHRYPSHLSGGQQQRAAIARALAMNPLVMLYDEPTSALDPTLVDEVLQVMKEIDREGMTQIVVTHEMRFAREASDYVIYMEAGEIVEIAKGEEIFENPKDERTRRFLRKFIS